MLPESRYTLVNYISYVIHDLHIMYITFIVCNISTERLEKG